MLSLKYAVRKYEPQDEGAVLALCDKYASWDATPTSADVQGFWAREPDLFLVAEKKKERSSGLFLARKGISPTKS